LRRQGRTHAVCGRQTRCCNGRVLHVLCFAGMTVKTVSKLNARLENQVCPSVQHICSFQLLPTKGQTDVHHETQTLKSGRPPQDATESAFRVSMGFTGPPLIISEVLGGQPRYIHSVYRGRAPGPACRWRPSAGCRASCGCGSGPRGGRPAGRPAARGSPAAGSPRTAGRTGPPASGRRAVGYTLLVRSSLSLIT